MTDSDTTQDPPVERVFVINLQHRTDRLEAFDKQYRKLDSLPPYTVWPAVRGDYCPPPDNWTAGHGAWGCYRSHVGLLEHCIQARVGSYMVFEDDAQFADDFDDVVRSHFAELPPGWWQTYMGGQLMHAHSHPPQVLSPNVYRPFNVNRTHCFAVGREGMVPIYRHICQRPFYGNEHIDHHLGRLHEDPVSKVYCPPRWAVGQHGSSSDVSGRNEKVQFYQDPVSLAIHHWLYTTPVCILYRGPKAVLDQSMDYLHGGDTINEKGYDVTLHDATTRVERGPTVARWYGWVRSEVATAYHDRLPVAYHPSITADDIQAATGADVLVVDHVATRRDLRRAIAKAWGERPAVMQVLQRTETKEDGRG